MCSCTQGWQKKSFLDTIQDKATTISGEMNASCTINVSALYSCQKSTIIKVCTIFLQYSVALTALYYITAAGQLGESERTKLDRKIKFRKYSA